MPEVFLSPTTTTLITNGSTFDLQVAYQASKPNILLVYQDENGVGQAVERNDLIDVSVDADGNLLITSFVDAEANNYSLDAEGNLIYTF